MALEDLTGTKFIDALVATNPEETDEVLEGDDHLRGVKNVLKKTFAFITGAVTATHAQLDYVKRLPSSLSGAALKHLRVNAGATGYEHYDVNTNNGRKNFIRNGDFSVWQRGETSPAVPVPSTETADGWVYTFVGAGVAQWSKQPMRNSANPPFGGSYFFGNVTTADTSGAAGNYQFVRQHIEGIDAAALHLGTARAKTVTLTFWTAHTKTGTYAVALQNGGGSRSYTTTYSQAVGGTWEKQEVLIALDQAGTWLYDTGERGLMVTFPLMAGSTYHSTANAWQANNRFSLAVAVNGFDSTSNWFRFGAVQLEIGAEGTGFEELGFAQQLAWAQRFYEKSYDYGVYAGAIVQEGALAIVAFGLNTGGHTMGANQSFKVTKAKTPTVNVYSTTTGTAAKVRDNIAAADATGNISFQGTEGFRWHAALVSNANVDVRANWVAEGLL